MDRRTSNKGYTLAEMCIVLIILSVLSLLWIMVRPVPAAERSAFASRYLFEQSEAMIRAHRRTYTDEDHGETVHFNEKGNTDSPRTIRFGEDVRLIIELGGGRLVFR